MKPDLHCVLGRLKSPKMPNLFFENFSGSVFILSPNCTYFSYRLFEGNNSDKNRWLINYLVKLKSSETYGRWESELNFFLLELNSSYFLLIFFFVVSNINTFRS